MARKIFSEKTKARFKDILKNNRAQYLRLTKATVYFYPFITGKGFQDVRKSFRDTEENLQKLEDYYFPALDRSGNDWHEGIYNLSVVVNARIVYARDKANWGKFEYWASPWATHQRRKDDCDGYALLLTQILRRYGISEYDVFVVAGDTFRLDGSKGEYHAYCAIRNPRDLLLYPVEGSWYGRRTMEEWKNRTILPLISNPRYATPSWMTNDKLTFSKIPWLRFTR